MEKHTIDIFSKIGEYGRYQKSITLLIILVISGTASNIIELIFTCYTPANYKCIMVNPANNVDLNVSDSCTIPNITDMCTNWTYETTYMDSTIVTLFDLYCDKNWVVSVVQASYMLGNLICCISSVFWDRFGRKPLLIIGLVLTLIGRVGSAFAMDVWLYTFFRFVIGAATSLVYLSGFILACEIVSSKHAAWISTISAIGWSISATILPGIAYLTRTKQYMELASSYMVIIGLLLVWIIPESPKWLAINCQYDKAIAVYEKIASKNGVHGLKLTKADVMFKNDLSKESFFRFIKHCTFLRYSLILYFYWFAVCFAYYGITLNIGSMAGNFFLNAFIVCFLDVIANMLAYYPLHYVGHKVISIISIIIPGVLLLCIIFVPSNDELILTVISITGKGFVSFAFVALYVYTVEIFPTSVRANGLGIASLFARIGGMLAPFILKIHGVTFGLVTLGIISIIAGLLVFALPNTKGKQTPQIISDCFSDRQLEISFDEEVPLESLHSDKTVV